MRLPRILILVAACGALAAAGVATAAPDRTQAFAAAGELKWDGPVATSVSPLFDGTACENPAPGGPTCDTTLIELKATGTLAITIDGWNSDSDLDLFFRKSDADGTYGEEAAPPPLGSGPGPEKLTVKNLAPGFYLIAVNYFQSVESDYKGVATFTPAGSPAPTGTPVPGATPPGGTPAPSGGGTPPPAAGGGGALKPSGQLAVAVQLDKAKLKAILKGVPVTVGCTVACKGTLTLTAKIGKKSSTIGTASVTVTNKQQKVKVKLNKKALKALKKAKKLKKLKVTLKAALTDSSGGQAKTATVSATYKK